MKMLMMTTLMMIINNKNNKMIMVMLILVMNTSMQKALVQKVSYVFMGDLISFWITNMSMVILYFMVYMSTTKKKIYFFMMTTLTSVLLMTFYNWNFLMFYMLFEVSMILILIIIITWGYQPERTEAVMFMIIMTIMFSLPMLYTMMTMSNLNYWFIEKNYNLMSFISFMLIFMMKMPTYFLHFWLPKVHVEAPVQGSMILAAIMLKLGCYGMMRMNKIIMKFSMMKSIIMAMSLWSMIILSMNCIMQTDIKTLIAYSSIVHMTMVFMNIFMMKSKSIYSSMTIILGHGMCSAALFLMADILYKNSKSRSIIINKGTFLILPGMNIIWFVACMSNAPMPPSMNMMGELISFSNIISWSSKSIIPVFMSAFMSSIYSIYLFYVTTHGKISMKMNKTTNSNSKVMMMLTMMLTTTLAAMTKPSILMI